MCLVRGGLDLDQGVEEDLGRGLRVHALRAVHNSIYIYIYIYTYTHIIHVIYIYIYIYNTYVIYIYICCVFM